MPSHDQSRYQVRFEWGVDGLARLASAGIVVVVDVLGLSSSVTAACARGETVALDAATLAESADAVAVSEAASGSFVVLGCLRNAAAVARAVLAEQVRRGGRTAVSVVAVGESSAGPVRFAVEDLLGAGAVIDALSTIGLDHTSPEAAAAGEAFRGLRGAVRHLLTASGSGQELIEADRRDEVVAVAAIDDTEAVPTLRDGLFTAL